MTRDTETRIVQFTDADEAIREIHRPGQRIVTFAGFSANGYEDSNWLGRLLSESLDGLQPASDIVCAGATADGIGAVYALASARGFMTIGIVSSIALKEGIPFATDVDVVFVIENDSWGGRVNQGETLSPISRVMVEVSDALVFIGGGDIARDECEYARARHKPIRFEAADMNHDAAIEQAQRAGRSPPTDFRGAVHAYMCGSGG